MPQLFSRQSDARLRRGAVIVLLALLVAGAVGAYIPRSGAAWNVGKSAPQPIPFQHNIHVRGLGLDCSSCHPSATRHGFAGMPSAHHCLTCHSHVLGASSVMEPLRTSITLGVEVPWQSVHRLPSSVRFHHGVHVQGGIPCETCHGRMEEQAQTTKAETLSMAWCLDCHRERQGARGNTLESARLSPQQGTVSAEHRAAHLTDCWTCHR